jgi:hypothetical protein
MARRKARELALKQKESQQKKLLILLVPLFLGLVAWQGPKMYKAFFGKPTSAAPAQAPTTTAPTGTATTPPSTPESGTETTAAAAPVGLQDTDAPPESSLDRLVSFSRFESRDPFGDPNAPASGSETTQSTGTGGSGGEQTAVTAVFDVNGVSETVSVAGQFPSSDPTFRLVSLSTDKAVVGLVSGSFEGGQDTVELAVGEQLELVADPDGTRYIVKLVRVG